MESAEPAAEPRPMPLTRLCWRVGSGLVVVYGPMLLWESWCLTGLGGWSTRGSELFMVFPIGGLLLLIASAPLVMIARTRRLARNCFIAGTLLLGGGLVALRVGARARMLAFRWAGERAAPLIDAVERHVSTTGAPPANLADLVPRWIPALPERLPPLEVVVPGHQDNPWMLRAHVPTGVLNFDEFVYLPEQNYPEHGWGGRVQRLGRWGYLHE